MAGKSWYQLSLDAKHLLSLLGKEMQQFKFHQW
jgi:hypothetical protein